MWLMLAEPGDDAAVWAAEGVQQRGVGPVLVVSGQELVAWTAWEHRLDQGGVRTRLRLPDGVEVQETQLRGVVNRLSGFYLPPAGVASSGDGDYAACERNALLLSWLVSLRCPVFNRPSPIGGLGGYRSLGGWRHLAHRAGLRLLPLIQSSDRPEEAGDGWGTGAGQHCTVFVVAGQVIADGDEQWDQATKAGCARLAQLVGPGVLAVQFVCPGGQDPLFCWATQQGDLRLGGSPLLDILASELT